MSMLHFNPAGKAWPAAPSAAGQAAVTQPSSVTSWLSSSMMCVCMRIHLLPRIIHSDRTGLVNRLMSFAELSAKPIVDPHSKR
jgi:hypothetical protein